MTGYTNPDALPFPDDYQQPADSPSAFAALANAVQVAVASIRAYAASRVIDSVNGTNTDLAPSQKSVNAALASAAGTATAGIDQAKASAAAAQSTANTARSEAGSAWSLAAGKADAGHGHVPSQAGIRIGSYTFASVTAGNQVDSPALGKNGDDYIVLQSAHPSTYIETSLLNVGAGSFQIRVRNATTSTNHTNIVVWYFLIKGA